MCARIVVRTQCRTVVVGGLAWVVALDQISMGMCREPMLVFRMVVIGVGVHVQRRALAGGRCDNQSEQDRDNAVHDFESMGALARRQTDRPEGAMDKAQRMRCDGVVT